MFTPGPRDWKSDFQHENGQYNCKCLTCGLPFVGHKRRLTCCECANKEFIDARESGAMPEAT